MSSKKNRDNAKPRPWSIRFRLAFLYAISASLLLAVSSAFLYLMLTDSLAYEDRRVLADKVQQVKSLLIADPDALTDLKEEIRLSELNRTFSRFYLQVTNADGNIVVESPGIKEILNTARHTNGSVPFRDAQGRSFLSTVNQATSATTGEVWKFIVMLYEDDEGDFLATYRRNMILILTGGILLSVAMGVFVTRKGLAPLNKIARIIGEITPERLGERINAEGFPDELKSVAVAFNSMLMRLEDSFRRLSRFSADLAHELRVPIQNLISEAGVTLSRPRTPDEYHEALASGIEECTRLSRLVDSLLFLARSENAETPIARESLDAAAEIRNVVEFHEALIEERKLAVSCVGNSPIHADPILFHRVIANLLTNAIQATPDGGKINIAVESKNGGSVQITFTDDGCGIAPEHVGKIFDRFYRVDPARTYPGGMGLGLSIVKSIIDLHGGTIEVRSAANQGTNFTLWFP